MKTLTDAIIEAYALMEKAFPIRVGLAKGEQAIWHGRNCNACNKSFDKIWVIKISNMEFRLCDGCKKELSKQLKGRG